MDYQHLRLEARSDALWVTLARRVGSSVAAELMRTGRFPRADRAPALDLVSVVVRPEQLEAEGEALAAEIQILCAQDDVRARLI